MAHDHSILQCTSQSFPSMHSDPVRRDGFLVISEVQFLVFKDRFLKNRTLEDKIWYYLPVLSRDKDWCVALCASECGPAYCPRLVRSFFTINLAHYDGAFNLAVVKKYASQINWSPSHLVSAPPSAPPVIWLMCASTYGLSILVWTQFSIKTLLTLTLHSAWPGRKHRIVFEAEPNSRLARRRWGKSH
jgi:hypothetical protein